MSATYRLTDASDFIICPLLCAIAMVLLQGVSIALLCKPCTSYDRQAVCPSVCLSVRPSVCHTLALSENDAS